MSRWIRRAGRGSFPILTLICLGLLLFSCSPTAPVATTDDIEGQPSPSQLLVYPDTPTLISTYRDTIPPGPGPEDTLISVDPYYAVGPGALHGMIFDFTPAERFEVFRSEAGTFRPLKDFNLYPVKKLVQGQTDVFRFLDLQPGSPGAAEYLARGVVGGRITTQAPKTNRAAFRIGAVSGLLDYTAPTGIPPDFRPMSDSLLYMEWDPFPGAVGYWVHVYQFTDQGGDEVIASTVPAPIYVGVTRDYFMAYTPASVTSYKIGDPPPSGMRIVTQRTLQNGQLYLVRVSAVDADGQFIAYTGESEAVAVFRSETSYRVFPLGAALVQTTVPRPPPPPIAPGPGERGKAMPTGNPRTWIYPAGTFPRSGR
jgi:hypothetical protein